MKIHISVSRIRYASFTHTLQYEGQLIWINCAILCLRYRAFQGWGLHRRAYDRAFAKTIAAWEIVQFTIGHSAQSLPTSSVRCAKECFQELVPTAKLKWCQPPCKVRIYLWWYWKPKNKPASADTGNHCMASRDCSNSLCLPYNDWQPACDKSDSWAGCEET